MSERTGTTPRRGPVQDPNGRRAAAVPPRVPRGSVPAGGTASARATAPRGSAAPRATAARG
ncbi:hypothetical protein, partial [Cellulomonas shaoxiangyii]